MTSRVKQLKRPATTVQICPLRLSFHHLEKMTFQVKQLKHPAILVQTCLLGKSLNHLER